MMRSIATALVLAALAWPATSADAETFDLRFYRYCAPGTLCGHASEEDYQQYICQAVEEMNLVWEPAGISFRPKVMAVDSTNPPNSAGLPAGKNKYYLNPGCADDDSFSPLREYWRDHVARAHTDSLSMMLTANWNTCCSGIPRTFKNLDHQHGIYCDADPDRGIIANGQLWAHEMGHHWSLPHTHSGAADAANGEDPTYDADAPEIRACSEWDANDDAVGCGDDGDCEDQGLGTCSEVDGMLRVEDTPADRGAFESCGLTCANDPDSGSCTTDADCDAGEGPCTCPNDDETPSGNLRNDHTWFASKSSVREITSTSAGISTGSPHATWCDVEIKTQTGGMTVGSNESPSVEVTVRDVMSYHGGECLGPYVRNGNRREAFTADQLARIAQCRQEIDPRKAAQLPDVCASRGGDDDHDGICDTDDNCPQDRNTCQADADGDGDGDACDLCPSDPSPTGDLDGDGIGDICDTDRDGDGCSNRADDHPDQALMPTYTTLFVGCPTETETQYVSEGTDTDGDGTVNCEDPDDDNDGLCDTPGPGCEGVDPCPEVKGICLRPASGDPCPPAWFTCGSQCVEFLLKATTVINPDPTRDLVFEQIWMANRTIFAAPLAGKTAAESVTALAERAAGVAGGGALAGADTLPDRIRLEVWQRFPGGLQRRVAIVGEYDAAHLSLGELARGGLLRLRPLIADTSAPILEVETTHAVGIEVEEARDQDGDGIPDSADNCVLARNPRQTDADRDGFGNACDADLDQDGVVDDDDLARYGACLGADLTVSIPVLEPESFGGESLGEAPPAPGRLDAALAAVCASTDFDGNGRVDEMDSRLAAGRRGYPPGPTAVDRGLRPPPPAMTPACVDPGPIQAAQIRLAGLRRAPGSQSVNLSGTLVPPVKFDPPLDPLADGVALELRDADAHALIEVHIPGGALDETGVGWTGINRGRGARYVNPEGLAGITAVVVKWNRAGAVRVRVKGNSVDLGGKSPALPLFWEVNLDPEPAATDRCGGTAFRAAPDLPACSEIRGGAVIVCR